MRHDVEIITLRKENISDFSFERNELLKRASKEWIFFLDADEKISKELEKEIKGLDLSKFDGFFIPRRNYFLGKFAGTDMILRLGRKDAGKWERMVHETWNIKGNVGTLINPIIHRTAGSVSEMISKINFYSTLHAEANKKEGKKASLLKIFFFPIFKFIESLTCGRGFVFSMIQAMHSFLSWSKLYFLHS